MLGLWIKLRFCTHKVIISVAGGKILLAKTIKFFHEKIQLFQKFPTHSLRSTCHSTCPLPQRILLSKRTSRLYESLLITCVPSFLREQRNFAFWDSQKSPESAIFDDCSACETYHGCTHANLGLAQSCFMSYVLS